MWLLPLPISLLAACLGLLFKLVGWRRLGQTLLFGGVALALAASYGPIANALLRPLEARYPAMLDAAALTSLPPYIAVLGSGYSPRPGLPVTAALDAVAVVRLAEGVRLLLQLPGAQLIVSGGPLRHEPPIARGYALAAVALGVPAASIILLEQPTDTGAEIRALHARIGAAPVLLVTSAAHMPRAMALSRREGLQAIAAPTGNLTDASAPADFSLALPSATSLRKSEVAFHEYVGLLALSLGIT
jgi:uncharacterized SAM-binding protein YcdF (DUF218 family)